MTSAHRSRRIFVTGGGSGIGLAIAQAFAQAGHEVVVAGRDRDKLQATALRNIVMDVSDRASILAGLADIGPIDVFVANAGAASTAPALQTSVETWERMLAVNLSSVFHCAQAAIPPMVERGWGRFIAVASTASLRGYAYSGAYAAAKHGVLGWVRCLAIELAKTGVTANALCPGFTNTPLVDDALVKTAVRTGHTQEEIREAYTRPNPMGRLIDPAEVAATALWLASDGAASINGQAIAIDGGETVS